MYTASYVSGETDRMKSSGLSRPEIIQRLAPMCLGWAYVWASVGEMCTPTWRQNRMGVADEHYAKEIRDNCPVLSGTQPNCDGCKWANTRVFDCQGFCRWLLEQVCIYLYGGGATTQWETKSNWVAQGEIATMPRGLLCCVFKRKEKKMSHEGMHMGKASHFGGGVTEGDGEGLIIHCSTTVKEDHLPGKPAWTHWAIPAGLYTTQELRKAGLTVDESKNIPTLRRGSQGDEVAELQALLNAKQGYDLEIDGNFGKATEVAVRDFQAKHGLTADGIVGPKTWAALGVSGNTNPPVDNGNNEIKPSEPPVSEPDIILTDDIKTAIRAAYASAKTACDILRKLVEG